jgi:hypothetical protein
MTVLIKDTAFSFVPGSPGTPGSLGTPARPAYCTTVVTPGGSAGSYETVHTGEYYNDNGILRERVLVVWVAAGPVTAPTSTTVCYPATSGTPPTAGTPGTASQLIADYKLGWNAGATSIARQEGDCLLSLQVSPSAVGIVAGLNNANEGAGYTEIDYGFYFTHGKAAVYELGISKLPPVSFVGDDTFKVQRLGILVRYLKNDTVLYISAVASMGSLIADASLYSGGDLITAASFGGTTTALWGSGGSASGFLPALAGLSGPVLYTETRGVLKPLAGSAIGRGQNNHTGVMPLLQGISSNKPYALSQGVLRALGGEASTGLLAPSYTLASGSIATLLGASRVLTGEVSSASGNVVSLAGSSANKLYAEVRGVLSPMSGFSAQAVPIDGYAFLSNVGLALSATGRDSSGESSATLVAPSPAIGAFGGANSGLAAPSPTLVITATVTNWGSADLSGPKPLLTANGKAGGAAAAYLTTTSPYKLAGYSGAVSSITLTGRAALTAAGTTGAVGCAAISCPLFELDASGTAQNHGSANLLAPSPRVGATAQAWLMAPGATLTAIGHAVVVATYEAYAVNLNHQIKRGVEPVDEVTHYTNFPFTHIVRYQNSYFGAAADGLYLLEGTTDGGAAISYAAKTAISDFDVSEKKNVLSAYFGGRIGPDMTVTLYAGETNQRTYAFTTPRGEAVQNHREKFARGVKNRYYALGVAGSGAMELDSIELEINKLIRRI